MLRLLLPIYAMIGTTLAGMGVLVVLVTGQDSMQSILWVAIAGFAVGVPVSWVITKRLLEKT